MLKSILFTHDDLDGAGCRIVYELANKHLKKDKDYMVLNCSINGNVKNIDNEVIRMMNSDQISTETEIWFADIVAAKDILEKLINDGYKVSIYDHHKTNVPATWIVPDAVIVPENDLGVLQSGTSLLYQHFSTVAVENPKDKRGDYFDRKGNQKLLSRFVDCVRSYDTYEWKETNNLEAKQIQTLFFLLGMERFCARYVEKLSDEKSGDVLISENDLEFVTAKIESEQKVISEFTPDDVYQIEVRGYKAAFVLGTRGASISELGYQFLSKYPEFDMLIGFSLARNGEFSFRTIRDDLDLGAVIAKPIGGGGHPKASGASIPDDVLDRIIDLLIDTLNAN